VKQAGSFSTFSSGSSASSGQQKPVASSAPIFSMQNRERNNKFFPRDNIIAEIGRALLPNDVENSAPTPNKMKHFVIHGFQGTGKTELAIEFAYQRRRFYDAVFFMSADSPELLRRGYCDIATE